MNEYCGEYKHNGQTMAMNIFAIDGKGASEHAESIRQSFKVIGRLECRIPLCDEQDTPMPETKNPPS